jgi:murein L,D-transpeptidase YcbB/YkuD
VRRRIAVQAQMKVIVGKALDTRTPLFDEDMRFIEFSPYWNVPLSIARDELVPRLRRKPAVFEPEGFEFVDASGGVSTTWSESALEAVLASRLRIRQRPGPHNPLGDIKFAFPNRESIYLHHTPSTRLFERERRDFSHGCIRVEQPVERRHSCVWHAVRTSTSASRWGRAFRLRCG